MVNSTFYPFAEKTLLTVIHSSGGSYVSNFYTKDPNFTDATGIVNASVNQTTYEPELVALTLGWRLQTEFIASRTR